MNSESMPSPVPDPIVIAPIGVPLDEEPQVVLDEDALLAALYRMERRQARELKRIHDKADKKTKKTARQSRRRNRP